MNKDNERLLTREEAANFLGVSKGTLEIWACTKRYPLPFVKIGRLAKYRISDLNAFVESGLKNIVKGEGNEKG